MQKPLAVTAIFLLAVGLLTGCSSSEKIRIGSFTMVSTRNIELSKIGDAAENVRAQGVEGIYLVDRYDFNKNDGGMGISAAVDDAVNKAAGDVMINCIVYQIERDGKKGYLVKGDVIRTMEVSK